jgi:hypothetical protein
MDGETVRFYARWKQQEGETLYEIANDLQALAGLFTAAGEIKEREDLHSIFLDMLSAHRIDHEKLPTVFKMSKNSPLEILLDIPTAWQVGGAVPVFALFLEHAIGKVFDLIKQYWEIQKLKEETKKLVLENAEREKTDAAARLKLEEGQFRYRDIAGRLGRIEYVAFGQWEEFPYLPPEPPVIDEI